MAVARATAAKVSAALEEHRPSPLGFERTTPREMVTGFLDYVENVKRLAWRTLDRYRAALDRFLEFCESADVKATDAIDERSVEDFVRWLRGQTRTRNGARKGKRTVYQVGGIKFILSTCRTAYHWAARRRMLPPYSENPFTRFPIDGLRDPDDEDQGHRIFTTEQERAFFSACGPWQLGIFRVLAAYGMRVGELTHLLIEDVDLESGTILIRSKSELNWRVKTSRRRQLPLTDEMRVLFAGMLGKRKAGFVFLNEPYAAEQREPALMFDSPAAFKRHAEQILSDLLKQRPDATPHEQRRAVLQFCRSMGQIPVKRVQNEFCKLTVAIGCPQFTRTHDLRHLFSSRVQERGVNPLLVQELLGHTSLAMTRKYTHLVRQRTFARKS